MSRSVSLLASALTIASIVSASVLVSSPAFASKARLQALGQSENGSSYIEDTRGIFLNPALLNKLGNFANFELGAKTTPSTPNAEGGLFHAFGGFKAGLQLGRESNLTNLVEQVNADFGTAFIAPQNTVEAMLAGGGDLQWGASLIYGSAEDKASSAASFPNKKASTFEVRGGVAMDGWHAYANIDLMGKSENETAANTTSKTEVKPGLRAGGAFDLSASHKIYADVQFTNFTVGSGGQDTDGSATGFSAGWVNFINPEANTRLFYTLGLSMLNKKVNAIGATPESKDESLSLPIVVGLENSANDWLTLRASVKQNVIIDQHKTTAGGDDTHNPNSTTVAAGTGLKWKNVTLDTTLAGSTTGNINGNELLANAGLTYLF